MRIIAGEFRGKKLKSPKSDNTRPTSDRLRERLFNILAHKLENGFQDIRVADIFAGTGALGLEALSRGAAHAVFIEKHRESIQLVQSNIDSINAADRAKILTCDARNLPQQQEPYDLIFIDPPYGRDLATPTLKSLVEKKWMGVDTLTVLEMSKEDDLTIPVELEVIDERLQGKTKALILKLKT
jgi:16S rRNA (guanine966-N2)-methyltransferase